MRRTRLFLAAVLLSAAGGCPERTTATLSPGLEQRFASEGVVRRAPDQIFHYTSKPGGRAEGREDRRASIIVTKSSVYIHKSDKVGLEITPGTRGEVSVSRSGERVRIRSGSGRAEELWSFEPAEDAAGWTTDIRAVTRQATK